MTAVFTISAGASFKNRYIHRILYKFILTRRHCPPRRRFKVPNENIHNYGEKQQFLHFERLRTRQFIPD